MDADTSTAAGSDAVASSGSGAWRWDRQRLVLIAAASVALLALIALVAAIDLPEGNDQEQADEQSGQRSDEQGSGGSGGALEEGRIDLGDGSSLEVKPIPGCPGGVAVGDDILLIPDPEACGYELLPPGSQGTDSSGKIILVPDVNGDIGGFRVGPDGGIQLLPPGEVGDRAGDLGFGFMPDGSIRVGRPDGTWLELIPGDDGLTLRDPFGGDSFFIPNDDGLPDASQFDDDPGAQDESRPDTDRSRNDDDSGSSFNKTLLWVLLALVALGIMVLIARSGWRPGRNATADEEDEGAQDTGVQDTVTDYSAELDALDRMLWEIDQERDPRTAIRRVYAALETGLDNPDMARRTSETPGIYLSRILGRFEVLDGPVRELTYLFEQARFSEHEITPLMRDRAVQALVTVRTHYARAAAQSAIEEPAF